MAATERDPRRIIEHWGLLATEIAPRVAPVLLVIRAAADADRELVALRDELDSARLDRMAANAKRLLDGGHLRADIALEHARDILFAFSAPELYDLLVLRQKWDIPRYGRFISDAMIAALLPPPRAAPAFDDGHPTEAWRPLGLSGTSPSALSVGPE